MSVLTEEGVNVRTGVLIARPWRTILSAWEPAVKRSSMRSRPLFGLMAPSRSTM